LPKTTTATAKIGEDYRNYNSEHIAVRLGLNLRTTKGKKVSEKNEELMFK